MTFTDDGNGNTSVGYNVTYVDWVGLPLEVSAKGGQCNAASHTTVCNVRESELRSGCPQNFLRSGQRCLSPRSYCLNGHQGEPYCNKLQNAINNCPSCPRGNTTEVYACSGPYAEEPRMCAALNRGMTHAPDDPDTTKYYQMGDYNDYAKWSHSVCPGIYAFSYDDWLSQSGYRACAGGNEVRITFCPGG
jgi:hypothetical protein